MGIGIDFAAPKIGATGCHLVVAVSLYSAPTHANMFVDRVIGSVDGDAPELTATDTRHHMTALPFISSELKTFGVIL